MIKKYNASKGKRGEVISSPGKTKITIRIDNEVLDWFRAQGDKSGGNYQTMMNDALRAFTESKEGYAEAMVRKVLREELFGYTVRKKKTR